MWQLSRIALGTLQPEASCDPLLWGLMSLCQHAGMATQAFQSRACFPPHDGANVVSGRTTRHLDSWIMSRAGCLRALRRGAASADLAIVHGSFLPAAAQGAASRSNSPRPLGGSLTTLCGWLDLPRVAVVDLSLLRERGLPLGAPKADALLLDRATGVGEAVRWQTELEALWGTPVLGWMDEAAALRAAIARLRPGANPQKELCHELGKRLAGKVRLDRLFQLASRSSLPDVAMSMPFVCDSRRKLRVAVAIDEDFSCHFPDTLDALDAVGAVVSDFSPLKNEKLPDHTDLVLLGCGHPERHLETLAANHCLAQSLRSFAAAGGRIYAEGSGLAYLCRQVVLPDGRSAPMTGLLPATARKLPNAGGPEPAEITFGASCWMADAGAELRGYRASSWQIEPSGSMLSYSRDPRYRCDLLGRGNIIGSRILTNFAAQPQLLRRFFYPYLPVSLALR